MSSLRQLLCAVRGHEEYLHFQNDRLYLQCVACGHESPGWTTGRRKYSASSVSRREKSARPEAVVAPLIQKVA
jgi:hypothetical protein